MLLLLLLLLLLLPFANPSFALTVRLGGTCHAVQRSSGAGTLSYYLKLN
jgi:hypothetical protein